MIENKFQIFPEVIHKLKSKTSKSNKKSYKFSLNDILDTFYENDVLLYKSYINNFFEKLFTWPLVSGKEDELFVKFVWYVNDIKTNTIIFQKNYLEFLKELSKVKEFKNEFERAIYKDISSVFSNWWIYESQEYFDIILERFYNFFNNTLFRNFIVIFCNEIYKKYWTNELVRSFLLDILSNNRKIHTVLKFELPVRKAYNIKKHEKKFIFDVDKLEIEDIKEPFVEVLLNSMLKKMNLKWSSLFSNQLRFFWYKRIKFMKNKELSWDTEQLELATNNMSTKNNLLWEESNNLYWYWKSKNIQEILSNIHEVFTNEIFSMSDISNNLYQILRINYKHDKEKYIIFFDHIKMKEPDLYEKMYFYIWNTIDMFYWKANI